MQILSLYSFYGWIGIFLLFAGVIAFAFGVYTLINEKGTITLKLKLLLIVGGLILIGIGVSLASTKYYRLRVDDNVPIGTVKKEYHIVKYDKGNDVFIVKKIDKDDEENEYGRF